jgi:hypothetical protein
MWQFVISLIFRKPWPLTTWTMTSTDRLHSSSISLSCIRPEPPHGKVRVPSQRILCAIGMDGGQRTSMSYVQMHRGRRGLGTTNFPYDDAVGLVS